MSRRTFKGKAPLETAPDLSNLRISNSAVWESDPIDPNVVVDVELNALFLGVGSARGGETHLTNCEQRTSCRHTCPQSNFFFTCCPAASRLGRARVQSSTRRRRHTRTRRRPPAEHLA